MSGGAGSRVERAFPLTPLQEGMLYHSLRAKDSEAYHVQITAYLDRALDPEIFQEAWARATRRHDALRTLFTWQARERPLQVVMEGVPPDIRLLDWSHLPESDRDARWQSLLASDRRRRFDLARAPLHRVRLVTLAPERHHLLWSAYHGILDGWSALLVLQEVLEDYDALAAGGPATPPPAPSFAQFVGWLEARASGDSERFWRARLAGVERPAPPPYAGSGPPGPERHRATRLLTVEDTRSVMAAATRNRVTLNTLAIAAWARLLGRAHSLGDVLFGTTVTERPPEIENVEGAAGLYLTTLPVRVGLDGAESGAWLRALQDDLVEAREHGAPGLGRIFSWAKLGSGDQSLGSLVVIESFPTGLGPAAAGMGGALGALSLHGPSEVPVALLVHPGEQIRLELAYDPARWTPDGAARILRETSALLTGVSHGELDAPEEGPPMPDSPRDVMALFATHVQERPEADAVVAGEVRWSYAELSRRAERHARRLRALGPSRGRVGLVGGRSPEMVAAMLGALKAGWSYAVMDASLPEARLEAMTQSFDLVLVEGAPDDDPDETPLPAEVDPDAPAYVVFTSGTTGTPKGVEVLRRNLAWSTAARIAHYRTHPETFLLLSPLSVDSAVAGLYWTLCTGGTLVLPELRAEQDAQGIARQIAAEGVTHTLLLPSLYDALLDSLDPDRVGTLEAVVVAGEACPPELVARHVRRLPEVQLHNEYGPSEGTVWATVADLVADSGAGVTIGHPVPGARVRVGGPDGRPVETGWTGEIWIGGPGVAAGYLGQPDLTAERFRSDDDMRWYRTGDLGRWTPEGHLQYLGRIDHQVKVRGHRVEPEEVEAALAARSDLVESAVGLDDKGRLAGWIVAREEAPSADTLSAFLAGRLPGYMIPDRWIVIDRLPRTPAGKLDRGGLSGVHGRSLADARPEFTPPRTDLEHQLAAIWTDVLGIGQLSVHDDFFEIGGDSLTSIRVLSRAARAGIRLTPDRFYENPTIAGLAAEGADAAPPAEQGPVSGDAPLSPVQRWFLETVGERAGHWNQAVLLELSDDLPLDRLERALDRLIRRHDALRTRFELGPLANRQIIDPPEEGRPLRRVDLSGVPLEARIEVLEEEATVEHTSLSLEEGDLFRAVLFDGGPGHRRLLLVAHHLVVDVVSWGIVLEDLADLMSTDRPHALPAKTASVLSWAARVEEAAGSPESESLLSHWRAFAEAERSHAAHATAGSHEGDVRTHRLALGIERTEALHRRAAAGAATPRDLVLAGLLLAWSDWSGRRSLRIDLERHGRELLDGDLDVSRTVGWFTTVLPMRLELREPAPAVAIEAVRRALGAGQGAGPDSYWLLRYGHPDPEVRADVHVAPGEVLFNYLGMLRGMVPPDAPFEWADGPTGRARNPAAPRPWDLEIGVREEPSGMEITIDYPKTVHAAPAITRLAEAIGHGIDQVTSEVLPLTPMQRLMLVRAASSEGPSPLSNQVVYELRGTLDAECFRRAVEILVERHEALRTAVLWQGLEQPVQVVRVRVEIPLEEVDLRSLDPAERQAALERRVREDAAESFDLQKAPLLRLTLVRLEDELHRLIWRVHHLVSDRWSHEVLVAELRVTYAALGAGGVPDLPAAGRFGDYVGWVSRQDPNASERFWRTEVGDLRRGTLLTDVAAPPHGPSRQEHREPLGSGSWTRLTDDARRAKTTPATLILGAIGLELAGRSGSRDPVWGVTVSGRPPELPNVERTVGSFVSTVPMRLRIEPDRPLGDWLRDLARVPARRKPHEHVSLADIRDWSGLPGGDPLFDLVVVLNLDSEATPDGGPPTWRAVSATLNGGFPVVLEISRSGGRLVATLVHDSSFDDPTGFLEGIGRRYDALLDVPLDARVAEVLPDTVPPSVSDGPADESSRSVVRGDDLAATVRSICEDILDLEAIDDETDLFALGASSLDALRIFSRLERALDRSLPFSTLLEHRTLRGLVDHLDRTGGAPRAAGIPRRSTSEASPLAFAQRRLWILDRIEGPSGVYNLAEALALHGRLDGERLRDALDALVERHEVLRTTYYLSDGEDPRQRIHPPGPSSWDWGVVDMTREESEEAVRARVAAEAWRPFDLDAGPLFRVRLCRRSSEEHVLLLAMHHSVSDAASIPILLSELSALYGAAVGGSLADLSPLPFQYADYALWQRGHFGDERLGELVSYWRDRLADLQPIELPTDRPRPELQSFRGATVRAGVPADLVDGLAALARETETTLFVVLMSAFHALLARYTSRPDIAVGTPVSGRQVAGTEALVGMFVNTLVLRSHPTPDTRFTDLIATMRECTLEAQSAGDLPFESLVEELHPERDLARHPLFQVLFSLQEAPPPSPGLPGVEVEPFVVDQDTSKFDLSLYLREEPHDGDVRLAGIWEYATDLFDEDTVVAMHRRFLTLLRSIVATPDASIATLELLDEDERRRILVERNRTDVALPDDVGVHRAVERMAQASPDRVALSDEETHLTYAELDARATHLAHQLRLLGAGDEVVVGVRLPRSVDQVVAVLAILKSGGAFLPLDPALPEQRIEFMLQDSGASIVVATDELADSLPAFGGSVVRLGPAPSAFDRPSDEGQSATVESDRLAYVMYTSGSTGRPKGVEVTHGNLTNLLGAMARRPGLSEDDVLLAVTTLSFDISLLELLGPLTVGARVHVASAQESESGDLLLARVDACRPTVMQATPASWRMMLDAGWSGDSAMRALVGGEALPPDLARSLVARVAEAWNMYGPTETTVWSTCWRVSGPSDAIRIGTPIDNTRLYVLDANLRPCPPGVPGELYIGGAGVARGYRHRPELTAERFVPDPFSHDPGGRLYRTGDRVVLHHDLSLEHLGRIDDQLKVRGFRIEPGEIEANLAEHSAIRAAAVVGRGAGAAMRLVAFVTLEPGEAVTTSQVRRYLRERLPDYMVPGLVIELDRLPLSASGKVDRRALPDPFGGTGRAHDALAEPPETETEKLIAEVWAALLGLDKIGRADNFYELGGHSLLGVRAASAIARRLGRRMDPRAMFFQNLAQLAGRIDAHEA